MWLGITRSAYGRSRRATRHRLFAGTHRAPSLESAALDRWLDDDALRHPHRLHAWELQHSSETALQPPRANVLVTRAPGPVLQGYFAAIDATRQSASRREPTSESTAPAGPPSVSACPAPTTLPRPVAPKRSIAARSCTEPPPDRRAPRREVLAVHPDPSRAATRRAPGRGRGRPRSEAHASSAPPARAAARGRPARRGATRARLGRRGPRQATAFPPGSGRPPLTRRPIPASRTACLVPT